MSSDFEKQIEEERARVAALDAKLDSDRTPAYKERLLLASQLLDYAISCGSSTLGFDCLQRAILKRKEVETAFRILEPQKAVEAVASN